MSKSEIQSDHRVTILCQLTLQHSIERKDDVKSGYTVLHLSYLRSGGKLSQWVITTQLFVEEKTSDHEKYR